MPPRAGRARPPILKIRRKRDRRGSDRSRVPLPQTRICNRVHGCVIEPRLGCDARRNLRTPRARVKRRAHYCRADFVSTTLLEIHTHESATTRQHENTKRENTKETFSFSCCRSFRVFVNSCCECGWSGDGRCLGNCVGRVGPRCRTRVSAARDGQTDIELRAAAPPFAVGGDGSTVELDQVAHDRQAEPEPAVRACGRPVGLAEPVEDVRQGVLRRSRGRCRHRPSRRRGRPPRARRC